MASMQKRDPDGEEENQLVLQSSGTPLREALRRYYHEYVCIPVAEQKRAKAVLEKIKQVLEKHMKSSDYAFGVLHYQGSSYEGLKVMREDEFDILVPIKMDSSATWTTDEATQVNGSSAPGYYFIRNMDGTPTNLDGCIVNGYVNPIVTYRNIQSLVDGAVTEMNEKLNGNGIYTTLRQQAGTALPLHVTYDHTNTLSIDLVPSIEFNGIQYVAKRHPKAEPKHSRLEPGQNIYDHLWRRSYSEKEKIIIRGMDWENECRRICLKILKTVRAKRGSSQLGLLSSYHLKTCMLHLNDDTSIVRPWDQKYLDVRFKDLLKTLIRFLENRRLPNFYNPSENLFAQYSHDSLQNILRWLKDIVQSDQKIIDILLEGGDSVNITSNNFQVFVRTTQGSTLTFVDIKKTTLVQDLKQKIKGKTGIPPSQQLLVFGGRNLDDGNSMEFYEIGNESTIHMTGRLRGG